MVKKIVQAFMLLFVLAAVFSGCSSSVEEVQKTPSPVIESDDGNNQEAEEEPVAQEEDEITQIVDDELGVDEADAEIGDLI